MVFLKNICNIKHVKQDLQKYSIFLNDSNHDYILEETEHRDTFYLEIDLRDDGDEEYFLLVLSYFFPSIELSSIIFPQYVYACDISHYPVM